jgi:hypothetical protein
MVRVNLLFVTLLAAGPALAQDPTTWRAGSGAWNDAERWTAGLPNPFASADVGGNSQVTVPPGTWVAGDLRIGTHAGDRARVEVDGGSVILVQDSLFVGEESGGQGEFVLNSGALHSVMDVFVGGATASAGRANDAVLRIRGGSFLGRTLSVGFGYGSHAILAVEGSQASAVHVLDYVYLQATADPGGRTGLAALSFTLDERGVTPHHHSVARQRPAHYAQWRQPLPPGDRAGCRPAAGGYHAGCESRAHQRHVRWSSGGQRNHSRIRGQDLPLGLDLSRRRPRHRPGLAKPQHL